MRQHRRDSAPETAGSDSHVYRNFFAYAYLRDIIDIATITSDKYIW